MTSIILYFLIDTLTHYVITGFLRFPEGFSAICSSYFISGFGAGNWFWCCLTVVYILHLLAPVMQSYDGKSKNALFYSVDCLVIL